MRQTYRFVDGELMTAREAWERKAKPDRRSSLPCPMFISDQTDIQSMADGKHYDSKSAYRASLKARGYHEVGNDSAYTDPKPPEMDTPGGLEADIKNAIEQLEGKL